MIPDPFGRSWVAISSLRIALVLLSLLGLGLGSARPSVLEPRPETHKAKRSSSVDESSIDPRLTLIRYDGHRFIASYFDTMARVVERTFGEIGVKVTWRSGDEPGAFEPGAVLSFLIPVVLIDQESSAWGLRDSVMGATMGRPGDRQAIYIFVPNVVRTLGLDFHGGIESPTGGHQLARAVGRIVAHEVVHAAAPLHPHRADGIMGRGLPPRMLLRSRLRLDAACSEAFLGQLGNHLWPLETAKTENAPRSHPVHVDERVEAQPQL
jgi:hypothetical protein